MEDATLQVILKRIRDLSDGVVEQEIEVAATKGIRSLQAHKGFLLCSFIVHYQ